MKTTVVVERPLFAYYVTDYGTDGISDCIEIFAKDLEGASVGMTWCVEDWDKYPNASKYWTVTVVLVYKDDNGVLLKVADDADNRCEPELVWIELHK